MESNCISETRGETGAENKKNHFKRKSSQTGVTASDRYWIGYTDAATEGTWVWDTGSSATYTNWLSSEPNGGTSENCTLTVATSGRGWGDFNCSATTDSSSRALGAVCEAR